MQSLPGDVVSARRRLNSAFYADPVSEVLAASDEQAYAPLAAPKGYTLAPEQLSAWHLQLPLLHAALADLPAGVDAAAAAAPWIHLEFDIPRLGRRVDAVLVTPSCVIPIEFKVGAKKFERLDYEQAWDYGLDLKNFHAPSHAAPPLSPFTIDPATWDSGSCSPKPTIVEAARSLYARHTVHAITCSDAGAVNLAATSGCIERIIAATKAGRELLQSFRKQFRMVLTRSMRAARRWTRRQRRATEPAGLVTSSSANRLKPHTIDIRVCIDPMHWFLSPAKDTRLSIFPEHAATDSKRKRPHENIGANTSRPLSPFTMRTSQLRQSRINLEIER